MLEFRWTLPGPQGQAIVLRLDDRIGWFGCKTLTAGDTVVFRRGRLEGIAADFQTAGGAVALGLTRDPGCDRWRPVLQFCNQELPEETGVMSPVTPVRPRVLEVSTGGAYLLMLMAVVAMPSIVTILDALYLRFAERKAILRVVPDLAGDVGLTVLTEVLPEAVQGQPYSAVLRAGGGTAPYRWEPVARQWPKGLDLDPQTGRLSADPMRPPDRVAEVRLCDAAGAERQVPLVIRVGPSAPRDSRWPKIAGLPFPPAVRGEPYRHALDGIYGHPPYDWRVSGLPEGLSFNPGPAVVQGTARSAGRYPVTVRLTDSSYAASRVIAPWLVPFAVAGVCLLGYWNMQRWAVVAWTAALVGQIVAGAVGWLPISIAALGLQAGYCLLGFACLKPTQVAGRVPS